MIDEASLLLQINEFLLRHDMAQSLFGREALGNPSFYRNLAGGRQCTLQTFNRAMRYMARMDQALAARKAGRTS